MDGFGFASVITVIVTLLAGLIAGACAQRGGGPTTREVVPTTVFERGSGSGSAADAIDYRSGPAGFPIPMDAATVEDTPPDHTFKIDRKQTAVVSELRVNLAQMGFSIDSEYVEDATHTHWYITKRDVHYEVTVAGDAEDHTLIILTID
ncbi:MAG: hypothetical protein ABI467_10675 [Kofleriaceae bacterium]